MRKISDFIVNNSKIIIVIYIFITLIAIVGISKVNIEYDLSAYLPSSMNSIKAKEILEKEFQNGGMGTLMIKFDSVDNVKDLKDNISQIKGIKKVVWLDDFWDLKVSIDEMPKEIKKKFISDDYTIMQIIFIEGGSSESTYNAIDKMEKVIDGEYYFAGESAIAKDTKDITSREIIKYSIVAFIVITIILILSSSTYMEPIYFFIAIGVAIVINMGSNFIFKSISSNTNSVASILQLAVSMDYSIFLLHRYSEVKKKNSLKYAMSEAIRKTFASVSASALTTIGGFLALCTMKYGIGKDIGIVLSKGVLFSLISVITLLPAIILLVDGKFKFKHHKILMPNFNVSAKYFFKLRYIIVIVALIIAIPVFKAQSSVNYYYSNEKTLKDQAISIKASKLIREKFGNENNVIAIVNKDEGLKTKEAMNKINEVKGVRLTQGLYSFVNEKLPIEFIPKEIRTEFESDKYTYFLISLDTPMEGKENNDILNEIKLILDKDFSESYLTGESVIYSSLEEVTVKDFKLVTLVSILIIGLILLITFKSLILPIILIFIIQLAIWINLSIPYFMEEELNFISFIILGAIQLGATVDYAILFTSRYKENIEISKNNIQAINKTIKDTGRAILTSSLILIAGTMSVSLITTIKTASELTMLIGRGALISLILVFILLPSLLLILNPIIKKLTLGWPEFNSK